MFTELFLFLAFVFILVKFLYRNDSRLPPGPKGLPIVGRLPIRFNEEIKALFEKHGGLVMIKYGVFNILYVEDPLVAKDLWSRPEFSDRPPFSFVRQYFNGGQKSTDPKGILFSNGRIWQHNRRFNTKMLREHGFGTYIAENIITNELDIMFERTDKKCDKPNTFDNEINVSLINVIYRIVANTSFSYEDDEHSKFLQQLADIDTNSRLAYSVDAFAPYLSFLKLFIPKLSKIERDCYLVSVAFEKRMKEIVEEHKETLDTNNPRDLVDSYLIEMEKSKDDPNSLFTNDDLTRLMFDLLIAGNESFTIVIGWSFLFLIAYPDVQKRIQEAIDSVVPPGEKVGIKHRKHLSVIDAFIQETLRLGSPGSISVTRGTNQDTEVNGYFIPKGTLAHLCFYHMHRNPKYWKDPFKYDIDRFLDAKGNFVPRSDALLPFGTGKRVCIGQGLSNMWLFLMVGQTLQRYSVSAVPGQKVDLEMQRIPHKNMSKKHQFVFTRRHQ